jgi:hypothetical protein
MLPRRYFLPWRRSRRFVGQRSASPHFLNAIDGLNWRMAVVLASAGAGVGAMLIRKKIGPSFEKKTKVLFDSG